MTSFYSIAGPECQLLCECDHSKSLPSSRTSFLEKLNKRLHKGIPSQSECLWFSEGWLYELFCTFERVSPENRWLFRRAEHRKIFGPLWELAIPRGQDLTVVETIWHFESIEHLDISRVLFLWGYNKDFSYVKNALRAFKFGVSPAANFGCISTPCFRTLYRANLDVMSPAEFGQTSYSPQKSYGTLIPYDMQGPCGTWKPCSGKDWARLSQECDVNIVFPAILPSLARIARLSSLVCCLDPRFFSR